MPAFNAARTIARAIRSVRAQPFGDWNLVVVDDASTDGTVDVARESSEGEPRIEIIRNQVNRGAASSMNLAWRRTDSRYVAVLDSDDAALPVRLTAPIDRLNADREISVLGGAAFFVDQSRRFLRRVSLPLSHQALERRRWYASPFIHPSVTLRREFLNTLGGYKDGLRLGEDYDLWMRGFQFGKFRYANLDEPLVIYTTRPVQRWKMIKASARVRWLAGQREGRRARGSVAAARILLEGALEQTGVFRLLSRDASSREVPEALRTFDDQA